MYSLPIAIVFIFCSVLGNTDQVPSATDSSLVDLDVEIPAGKTVEQYVQEVTDFWTDERLNQAIPQPLLNGDLLPTNENSSNTTTTNPDEHEKSLFVQQTLPTSSSTTSKRAGYPNTVGKVFYVSNGNSYSCSASVVTANNRDMIFTAGHCVYSITANAFVTNFIFIPQYDNNTRPYGTWVARALRAFSSWASYGDLNADVAVVLLYTLNGQHIQDVVGGQAVGFNYGHSAIVHSFGYPSNYLNGQMMTFCTGTKYFPNYSTYTGDAVPCGMNQGCSGGPWLQSFSFFNLSGIQTSVNSFTRNATPNVMYGPYFGSSVLSMYNELKDNTGTTGTPSIPRSEANCCLASTTLLLLLRALHQYFHNSFLP